MAQTTTSVSEIARYLDEGIQILRWCRDHLAQRLTVEKLRQLEITLAAIGLALDHEMEAEFDDCRQALRKADWRFGMKYADDDEDYVIECG